MKSHIWLLEALLHDCAVQCSVPPNEIVRDLRTISIRVESEGISFLTITLPAFGSAFLQALSKGCASSTDFPGFGKSAGTPAFLRGFLRRIFDTSGNLLDKPDVTAIACLHQICNTFKKVALLCSDARVDAAFRQYVQVDQELPDMPEEGKVTQVLGEGGATFRAPPLSQLVRDFNVLFRDALLPLDRKIFEGERLNAKHGPGATAERVRYNDKFRWTQWTERLAQIFDSDLYLHAMEGSGGGDSGSIPIPLLLVAPEQETPVRVITVPKTQKTPRIIAIEPVSMQFMQQGLLDGITNGIRSSFIGRSVLFDDQTVNANRALSASRSGIYATMDLKEASDRVTFWIVEHLVGANFPSLFAGLDATRSRHATLPRPEHFFAPRFSRDVSKPAGCETGREEAFIASSASSLGMDIYSDDKGSRVGDQSREIRDGFSRTVLPVRPKGRTNSSGRDGSYTIKLRKFASMGSAVCFPVEAIVFATIAFRGVADCRRIPLTPRNARIIADCVSVFGDDIIVPNDCAPTVAAYLEAFGLKVNYRKSFWTGKFRESCGTDAYDGVEVTPAYLKTLSWGDRSNHDWLASWVEFSNTLYDKGFWETSRIIRKRIANAGYRIPMVSKTSPAVGYHNVRGTYEWHSWDNKLHRPMVHAYQHRSSKVDSLLDGTAALRKVFTTPFNEDRDHLSVATQRSSSVSTKKRWTAAF